LFFKKCLNAELSPNLVTLLLSSVGLDGPNNDFELGVFTFVPMGGAILRLFIFYRMSCENIKKTNRGMDYTFFNINFDLVPRGWAAFSAIYYANSSG
jgi:hypothetical protein